MSCLTYYTQKAVHAKYIIIIHSKSLKVDQNVDPIPTYMCTNLSTSQEHFFDTDVLYIIVTCLSTAKLSCALQNATAAKTTV
jgi:hypothetical protein